MLVIGHRGAKGLAPENTLAALEAGLSAHASMLEVDVRVTADNVAVLHHDPLAISDEGKKISIAATNFTDLQLAKANLLTLEAALHFVDRRADILIELKPGVALEPVMACIKPRLERNWLESDFIITSFDYKTLARIHREHPTVHLAVLEKWSGLRATWRARRLRTSRIIMNQRWVWSGFIRSVVKGGYKLSVYTLNNPKKARRWAKAGLYGAITDYPDRLMS